MKNLLCLFVAGALLMGCKTAPEKSAPVKKKDKEKKEAVQKAKEPVGVQDSNPGEYMFVAGTGTKAWYSSLELEKIVRDYITKKDLDFDFPHSTKAIWVNTDGGKKLGNMYFQLGNGDFLQVEIGRSGEILGHKFGPAKKDDK